MTSWEHFCRNLYANEAIGLRLDLSRMNLPADFFERMKPPMNAALAQMAALESGAIANTDEKRQVGHYWLRAPERAPNPAIHAVIAETLADIKAFAAKVHAGQVMGAGGSFENLLLIGIGGSALGPQFVARALSNSFDRLKLYCLDNTDPDGMDGILSALGSKLGRTLTVVISKSGGTKETRNAMLETARVYESQKLSFAAHVVAVTGENSELDETARKNRWLHRFAMWDWVGGRTSELSAVGLVPAALQGFDIDALIDGARKTDEVTRNPDFTQNPAALLALSWYFATDGKGRKDMVILPYKDRLELLSRYLQQLIMESLGKADDRTGKRVEQGIAVYGNKGSTDQHAYVQQLRDGVNNFFVTFVEVLKDRNSTSLFVEPDVTSGDYLSGFLQGTRTALHENGRGSVTLTLTEVSAFSVGVLLALFERAVGLYAELINVNAYHQPGVEAGKKAATAVLSLQTELLKFLRTQKEPLSIDQIAAQLKMTDRAETIFHILEHAAANSAHRIVRHPGPRPTAARYQAV